MREGPLESPRMPGGRRGPPACSGSAHPPPLRPSPRPSSTTLASKPHRAGTTRYRTGAPWAPAAPPPSPPPPTPAATRCSTGAYTAATTQQVRVPDGYNTLTAYTHTAAGCAPANLFAEPAGGRQSRTAVPVSAAWTVVTIRTPQRHTGLLRRHRDRPYRRVRPPPRHRTDRTTHPRRHRTGAWRARRPHRRRVRLPMGGAVGRRRRAPVQPRRPARRHRHPARPAVTACTFGGQTSTSSTSPPPTRTDRPRTHSRRRLPRPRGRHRAARPALRRLNPTPNPGVRRHPWPPNPTQPRAVLSGAL
jgi:hypothetical protein